MLCLFCCLNLIFLSVSSINNRMKLNFSVRVRDGDIGCWLEEELWPQIQRSWYSQVEQLNFSHESKKTPQCPKDKAWFSIKRTFRSMYLLCWDSDNLCCRNRHHCSWKNCKYSLCISLFCLELFLSLEAIRAWWVTESLFLMVNRFCCYRSCRKANPSSGFHASFKCT